MSPSGSVRVEALQQELSPKEASRSHRDIPPCLVLRVFPCCESRSWRNPQGADPLLTLAPTGLFGVRYPRTLKTNTSAGPLNAAEQYPAWKALPSVLARKLERGVFPISWDTLIKQTAGSCTGCLSSRCSVSQVLGLQNCYENLPSSQAKQTPPPLLFYMRVKRNDLPRAKQGEGILRGLILPLPSLRQRKKCLYDERVREQRTAG